MDEARALVKELLDVPAGYDVVYLGGGASLQFCMVPFNLLKKKAAYLETGTWAVNAIKEAKLFGEVDVVASSKEANFTYIPKDYTVPEDADYFHITTNNTIYGTEIHEDIDSPIPPSDPKCGRIPTLKYLWLPTGRPTSSRAPLMYPNTTSSMPEPKRTSHLPV